MLDDVQGDFLGRSRKRRHVAWRQAELSRGLPHEAEGGAEVCRVGDQREAPDLLPRGLGSFHFRALGPKTYRAGAAAGLRKTATISTPRNHPAKSRSSEKSAVSAAEVARRPIRFIPVGLSCGTTESWTRPSTLR